METAVKKFVLPSTVELCQEAIDGLTERIIKIEQQLIVEQQLIEARGRDTLSDPVWYGKTNAALRICRAQRERLFSHKAALLKVDRARIREQQDRDRTFEGEFIRQAKLLLTGAQYKEIIEAVYAARPDLPR